MNFGAREILICPSSSRLARSHDTDHFERGENDQEQPSSAFVDAMKAISSTEKNRNAPDNVKSKADDSLVGDAAATGASMSNTGIGMAQIFAAAEFSICAAKQQSARLVESDATASSRQMMLQQLIGTQGALPGHSPVGTWSGPIGDRDGMTATVDPLLRSSDLGGMVRREYGSALEAEISPTKGGPGYASASRIEKAEKPFGQQLVLSREEAAAASDQILTMGGDEAPRQSESSAGFVQTSTPDSLGSINTQALMHVSTLENHLPIAIGQTVMIMAGEIAAPTIEAPGGAPGYSALTDDRGPLKILKFELDPASLGSISVKMRMMQARVEIEIEVQTSDTLSILHDIKGKIATAIGVTGYAVDAFDIRIVPAAQPDSGQMRGQDASHPPSQGFQSGERSFADGDRSRRRHATPRQEDTTRAIGATNHPPSGVRGVFI
ncbi:hypothetical protein LG047_04840 [Methylocystis sp. WRRC1]|uniref:hypothetical protein n=1 Tax=Methylocystis sp. WRRC1 TaxID=1732014 RepID=UPI001D145FA5|nr:hypothetical protein [Methylocystis sp. WRRC1]MCC3244651.1 hypothetical protein [Methylocystis sp. WRRC1]